MLMLIGILFAAYAIARALERRAAIKDYERRWAELEARYLDGGE